MLKEKRMTEKGTVDLDRASGVLIFTPEAVITEERVAEGADTAR
jgi:hypothetical protein